MKEKEIKKPITIELDPITTTEIQQFQKEIELTKIRITDMLRMVMRFNKVDPSINFSLSKDCTKLIEVIIAQEKDLR